jgi:hypothetical protein
MIKEITPLMDVKNCKAKLDIVYDCLNDIKRNEENFEKLDKAQSYLRQMSKDLIFLERKLKDGGISEPTGD